MTEIQLHEAEERLQVSTLDLHRAISSLREELEAVDWYRQRADATQDPDLREILEHNMDEELEHAVMVLEWMRRREPRVDHYLREILFSDETDVTRTQHARQSTHQTLQIGSTRRG